ncbi:MAG: hypothetical protein JOY54_01815 [Acidobacteriaceae bacterium]|nr:hypothetical protein [Acidobacteriaceae bacterium]
MLKLAHLPLIALISVPLSAFQDFSAEQLKLLRDPGGWEYIFMGTNGGGMQTQHTCFDGHPHPDECSGVLTFRPGHTFVQATFIQHQKVARRGKYQLDGDQLTFFDEFGTQDGPYTVAIHPKTKIMTLDMPQVHIQLELHSQYVADLNAKRAPAQ